jgi:TrmH family RNA methyltransferase
VTEPLRVVLVSPRNPLNIGAAARAMSNFGFTELGVVNPYDVAYREARSAIRSNYILEKSQNCLTLSDAVSGCTLVVGTTAVGNRDLHVPLYRLETGARLIREHIATGKAALLFGSEKFGLSKDDMSRCHWLMRIPTRTEHGSMNLGQAVAICLYELRRDASAAVQPEYTRPAPAPADDLERLASVLMNLLSESGYTQPRTAESTELKLNRLIHRLNVSAHDVEILLGMLRHVLWKLRQHPQESEG